MVRSRQRRKTVGCRGVVLILLGLWLLGWGGVALSITCEECQALKKKKDELEQQIEERTKKIQQALDKKQAPRAIDPKLLKEVTEFRKEIGEIARKLEKECEDACKPEVVKEAECARIRKAIAEQENPEALEEFQEKVDRLYRDLLRCNEELARLRRTRL